jgi:hypothetical protein
MTEYKWFVYNSERSDFQLFENEEDAKDDFNSLVKSIEEYAEKYGEYYEESDILFGRICKRAVVIDVDVGVDVPDPYAEYKKLIIEENY